MQSNEHQADHLQPPEAPILFFDGVCGLCNRTVDFAIRHDSSGRILFAPLQSEAAASQLDEALCRNLNTVVFKRDDEVWTRSAAIARLLWAMGGIWRLAGWALWLIPLPLRDLGYRLVAAGRYRMFGKKSACRLPTPEERSRFLD